MEVDTPKERSPMLTSPMNDPFVNTFNEYPESRATILETILFSKTLFELFSDNSSKVCTYDFKSLNDHFIMFDFKNYNIRTTLEFESKFEECLQNSNINMIIVPLGIDGINPTLLHANVLVINKITRRIDHFEPLGLPYIVNSLHSQEVIRRFIYSLASGRLSQFKYSIVTECPSYAYQQLQIYESATSLNHCLAWVLYVVYHVLQNPHFTVEAVLEKISITAKGTQYNKLIRRFIGYLETRMDLEHEVKIDTQRTWSMQPYVSVSKELMETTARAYFANLFSNKDTSNLFDNIMRFRKFTFFKDVFENELINFLDS
ncbi:MAG: hypothetical protein EBU90_09260 [Proteobacteria bacterium]|nr:hypothetical protein [Pseudomonadota bacterium]NBP13149.1 hypothetical protein [bacterium]